MHAPALVDRRFFEFLTDLLLCSRCLARGVRTPVPQAISRHHKPVTLCRGCREGARSARH